MSSRLRAWLHKLRTTHDPRPANLRTDGELVTAFAESRDDEAFAELVRRHGPMVLATCRRVLYPDTHTADDAFQAAFLVLATKAAAVYPPERVGAWLHGVAVHVAKKARAWVRKIAPSAPSDLDKVPAYAIESDPDAAQVRKAIDDVLAGLPAKYRSPVVLCELEGRSRAEAAQVLGWTEGTLSGRLARAKKLLAARLARRGFALPSAGLAVVLLTQPAAASVPAHLVASTIQAAALVAAGAAATEVTSEPVAALAREGLPTMTTTFKVLAAGIAGLGFTLGGFGLFKLLDKPTVAAEAITAPRMEAVPVPAPVALETKGWVKAHTIPFNGKVTAVAVGPDFVVGGDQEGHLTVFDLNTGKLREKISQGTDGGGTVGIDRIQLSLDGKWLFMISNDGEALHGCTIEKKDRKFPGAGGSPNMKFTGFTADGNHILALRDAGKELVILENKLPANLISGQGVGRFKLESEIKLAAAESADLAVTIADRVLRCKSLGKDRVLWEVKLDKINPTTVAVGAKDTLVAVGGAAGELLVFDMQTGRPIVRTESGAEAIRAVAFSPDGKLIATASEDKMVRIHEATSGKELAMLKGHTGEVASVAFSPDGEKIVSGSKDKSLRIWEFKK